MNSGWAIRGRRTALAAAPRCRTMVRCRSTRAYSAAWQSAPAARRQSLAQPYFTAQHLSQSTTYRAASSSAGSSSEALSRTPLYDFHLSHGAKMVPYGGFSMPVLYTSQSLAESHNFTRTHASLFDVSHMAQRLFSGPGAAAFLQRITPSDVTGLAPGRSTLSALLHPTGGIVDDCVIVRLPDGAAAEVFAEGGAGGAVEAQGSPVYYMVTNAACRDKDDAYLDEQLRTWKEKQSGSSTEVHHQKLQEQGLVALQGPEAAAALADVLVDTSFGSLKELFFGHSGTARITTHGGKKSSLALVSRGGYTGEDGFEISVAAEDAVAVAETLCDGTRVRLAGLGPRDSLRLEAGMCLYGHDLDDSTTPGEAGLGWIVAKERRQEQPEHSFLGADTIVPQVIPKSKGGSGVQCRRVGLTVEGAPAREGAEIVHLDGGAEVIGRVTSGCPSPTLGKNIAMGYVKDGFHKAGTELGVLVRGKKRKAVVTKMPFVPTQYWKGPS